MAYTIDMSITQVLLHNSDPLALGFSCDTLFPSLQATPLRRSGHINWQRSLASGFSESDGQCVHISLFTGLTGPNAGGSRPAFAHQGCQIPASCSFPRQGYPFCLEACNPPMIPESMLRLAIAPSSSAQVLAL